MTTLGARPVSTFIGCDEEKRSCNWMMPADKSHRRHKRKKKKGEKESLNHAGNCYRGSSSFSSFDDESI